MTGNFHVLFFLNIKELKCRNYLFGYKYKGFDNSSQTWHARSIGGGLALPLFVAASIFFRKKYIKKTFFGR